MAAPYTSQSITGYNANPPSDDGSQTESNRVKWSTIKAKLPDPLKDAVEAIDAQLLLAFAKVIGGGGVTSTATNYTVGSADQGKLVRASAGSITITTPDATNVAAPFVFAVLNDSSADIILDGSGSQTIDGDAEISLPAGTGVILFTDGTNWYTSGQPYRPQIQPQGYLTLTTGTPVITADVSAGTSVFYTPDQGDLIPIYNGTIFIPREFSELTLSMNSNHAINTLYDCFVFDDAGTLRLVTGPAWSSSAAGTSARGAGAGTTQISRSKGLWTNTVSMTARNGATTYTVGAGLGTYVGTILVDGTAGQITCHRGVGQSRRWSVWNAYNKKRIVLRVSDPNATWAYSTATLRPSRNDTTNSMIITRGLAEDFVVLIMRQNLTMSTTSVGGSIAIGINSTTLASGYVGITNNVAAVTMTQPLHAEAIDLPAFGRNDYTSLETGNGNSTATWNGASGHTLRGEFWG